jgi:tRNA-2-methylthio-N6-dimethylallyladenosine synthase
MSFAKKNIPAEKIWTVVLAETRKVFMETYGCQMNVSDSEIVVAILQQRGYSITENIKEADIILVNTCSVRENAEQRVFGRLEYFRQIKKNKPSLVIGVLGCMAERLKDELLEKNKTVDLIAGPDSYRDLPELLKQAGTGQKAVNIILSQQETYADINPVRLDEGKVSAFVTIMRGCNNMCAYCVVPYARGKERSRDPETIVNEVRDIYEKGYKEITLLGQNVDSYRWKNTDGSILNFENLLEKTALVNTKLRVRFATSHPKDMNDEVLHIMAKHHNICKSIHLPLQSGSTAILKKMNRKYTREWYMERIESIRKIVPDCAVSADIIAGFCGEKEKDHQDTLDMMRRAAFDFAFMFKYSVRPGTYAADHYPDDVPEEIKSRRLTEIINLQIELSEESKKKDIGKTFEVLVEGVSKKSENEFFGRTSQNKVVVFPKGNSLAGDYVNVCIKGCTSATLIGEII